MVIYVNDQPVTAGDLAVWCDQAFALPGLLVPGDRVSATQSFAGETSVRSPMPAEVQDPLESQLSFVARMYECGQCVWVAGAVPGAKVEVIEAGSGDVRGSGRAPNGDARFGLSSPTRRGDVLEARVQGCGAGPAVRTPAAEPPPVESDRRLGPPSIHGPLRACDRGVVVGAVVAGATVTLERTDGPTLTSCFDAGALRFPALDPPLREGEQLRASQAMVDCDLSSDHSPWVIVEAAEPVRFPL